MEWIAIITLFGMGFVLGMYVTTQIGRSIDGSRQNEQLLENMEKMDREKKR